MWNSSSSITLSYEVFASVYLA